jgi:hypothetical protein
MARRGRFTSPNSGGQNLTALITSLLRERNSAEEQALLNAYRTGTAYNGAVPTANDIQAFYDQWASASGYTPGSLEYQAIFQKKSDLNNYDLKKQFNALISTFNTTDGSNYQDIIDFLGNEAQTSTDPNDISDYANSIETTTNAYLKYQGQRLIRGELTAAEYQKITLESLKVLDPDSTAYKNAVYDAFQYEWNAEATKWQNRVKAGTATSGQFRSWANSFKNRMVGSGISKDSDLYTSVGASISQAGLAVGDSPTNTRLNKTLNTLNNVFNLAKTKIGGVEIPVEDIMSGSENVLKNLTKNPDLMGLYAEWLDSNSSSIDPSLIALGITDGASFRQWFEDTLDSGMTDAQAVEAAGGKANFDDWADTARSNGSLTTFDEFAVVSSKHARDVASANGDDSLIDFYDNEYRKFLAEPDPKAAKSYYGDRPSLRGLYPEQFSVVQNEANAMNGSYAEESLTLTGALNGGEPRWSDIPLTIDAAAALSSGAAVKVWNKETGQFTTEPPRAAGAAQGSYQYVSFTVLPDGTKVPSVVSVLGKKTVSSTDGVTLTGYIFELPNGKTYGVNPSGDAYELTGSVPVTGADYEIDDFADFGTATTDGRLPLIDTIPFIRQGANAGAFRPEDREARRAALTQYGVDAADLDAAAELALTVAAGLDRTARAGIEAASQALTAESVTIRATALESSASNVDQLAQAAGLRGNPAAAQYNTFVKPNMDKYEEVAKGLFRLKDLGAKRSDQETNKFLAMGGQLTGNRFDTGGTSSLPDVVDLRPESVKSSSRERDVAAAERIFAGYGVASTQTPSDSFFRNMPTTKKQQYGSLPPVLPPAAMAPSVVIPKTPSVRMPDIMGPVMPTAPVVAPPPPLLPPSRGGGVRKL